MVPWSSELPLRDCSPLTDLSRAFLCPNWCWTLFTRGLSIKRSAQQPLCCWLSASRFSLDVTFPLCWECFSLRKDLYTLPSALWYGCSTFPLRSCLHQVISSIEQKRKYLYFYNAKNAHKDLRAKSPVFMRFFIIQAWFVLYSFFMFLRRKTLDKAAFLQNLYRFSIQFLQSPSHFSLNEEISKAYGIFFKVCWIWFSRPFLCLLRCKF